MLIFVHFLQFSNMATETLCLLCDAEVPCIIPVVLLLLVHVHCIPCQLHNAHCTTVSVNSGHCIRQPPPYYNISTQFKLQMAYMYINLCKVATSVLQTLTFGPWMIFVAQPHFTVTVEVHVRVHCTYTMYSRTSLLQTPLDRTESVLIKLKGVSLFPSRDNSQLPDQRGAPCFRGP